MAMLESESIEEESKKMRNDVLNKTVVRVIKRYIIQEF